MKKYIIGNWKSNKTYQEVINWFEKIANLYKRNKLNLENLEIVICPSYIHLPLVKKLRDDNNLPIKIGSQNISPFSMGAYTGEVCANQIKDFAEYVLIGHSERRINFYEDESTLNKKVQLTLQSLLKPIYCVSDSKSLIPKDVDIVAYEPVWAIGSGKSDDPDNANFVAGNIKQKTTASVIIYGGSVNPINIRSFLTTSNIDGVLPGGASLDPILFWEMLVNAVGI